MKALIGLAGVAIAVLTAGGIKAALPGAPTGPDPSEGKATQVRVTAVVDGDTLRVEDLGGRGVRLFAGERLVGFEAACGAAGQKLVDYVDVVVVDVAQQPVVAVAVGLGGVGDELNGAADRRELLEQVCCLVGVALRRRR